LSKQVIAGARALAASFKSEHPSEFSRALDAFGEIGPYFGAVGAALSGVGALLPSETGEEF
jgi:hypothetical protein